MGDIADMYRDDAALDIMEAYFEAKAMTEEEIIEAMNEIIQNKKENGYYIHSFYEVNEYTPMIKSIVSQYKSKGFMSEKQRNALNHHFSIHGNIK